MSFAGGAFRDLSVSGITSEVLNTTWLGGWYSSASNKLWVVTSDWIVGIDLSTSSAQTTRIPLFFDVSSFAGTRTARGDLIAVGTMSDAALFDGTRFIKVAAELHHSSGLYIDTQRATLYEAEWRKMLRYPLQHPQLNTGPG